MSVNIFKQEFKMNAKSVTTWSAAIVILILIYLSLFSSVAKDAELLNEMMANFPEALLTAFGLNGINLSTVIGYYSFVFLFVQICLAIQAANYGFSLVSVEEREWTADFLLTKPVGRTQILTSKLLAALCGLTLTNIVVWISSFGFIEMFRGGKAYEIKPLLLMLASIIIFQLFFLSVGLVVSLMVKHIRSVT
ncbi:MAG: ABC transporter permease subunit, partial [Chloroflexi bacterium]|nr:ABC transporter permease subunit [Chloroflexota bacterium]